MQRPAGAGMWGPRAEVKHASDRTRRQRERDDLRRQAQYFGRRGTETADSAETPDPTYVSDTTARSPSGATKQTIDVHGMGQRTCHVKRAEGRIWGRTG